MAHRFHAVAQVIDLAFQISRKSQSVLHFHFAMTALSLATYHPGVLVELGALHRVSRRDFGLLVNIRN